MDMFIGNLTKGQKEAFTSMRNGGNVFLTGGAGTGKSKLIETYYKYAVGKYGSSVVAKTSTTGISALNISGKTIHSWSGIKLGLDPVKEIMSNMSSFVRNRWRSCKVLFIDEISMMDPEVFDKLSEIGSLTRTSPLPFGGIQVILIGDFFQLPNVRDSSSFCFSSDSWKKLKLIVHNLTEIIRQKDPIFQKILNEVRIGSCSEESAEILTERVGVELKNKIGILPTRLYPINKKVDSLNDAELKKLLDAGAKSVTYQSKYTVLYNKTKEDNQLLISKFKETSNIPDTLVLAVGAQVIFKKNIKDTNIVNGSRGVVKSFVETEEIKGIEFPVIALLDGTHYIACPDTFSNCVSGCYEIVKTMVPLKLAWACSIHSSQGLTLDYVVLDIGKDIFEFGQAYVALSRCRSLEELSLVSFNREKIFANPSVIEFYEKVGKSDES